MDQKTYEERPLICAEESAGNIPDTSAPVRTEIASEASIAN
jgi:hypothetical protein